MQWIRATIRQQWFWACQNKPFWIHSLLTVVTVSVFVIKPASGGGTLTDLPVRFWGMCLQLIGAYTVWIDLTGTAKDFGAQPLSTFEWFKNFFKTRPAITGTAIVLEGAAAASAFGTASLTVAQPSLEERVENLEKESTRLRDDLSNVQRELRNQKNAMTAGLQELEAKLQQEIRVLQDKIKDAFIGNYNALRVGAIWLVFGIVLSSVAVEITNLIHLRQLPNFW